MNKYNLKWYDVFYFNNDNINYYNDNDIIIKVIKNIENMFNNNYILLYGFYNSIDENGRNILHYLHINNLEFTYLYYYICNNNLISQNIKDLNNKKPNEYLNNIIFTNHLYNKKIKNI